MSDRDALLSSLSRVILVTGHYGSGKTNLSVNLALDYRRMGRDVVLCDLDIVNPYFRSADFENLMHQNGIATISPTFANTNLDIPAVGPGLSAAVAQENKTVIVDVGGDDAGAIVLGRYAPDLCAHGYSMLYVYNHYRCLTRDASDACEVLDAIRCASRLEPTHVVNNSNLGDETDAECIAASAAQCQDLCRLCSLPLLFTTIPQHLVGEAPLEGMYPVKIYVRKPWETPESSAN